MLPQDDALTPVVDVRTRLPVSVVAHRGGSSGDGELAEPSVLKHLLTRWSSSRITLQQRPNEVACRVAHARPHRLFKVKHSGACSGFAFIDVKCWVEKGVRPAECHICQ